MLSGRPIVIWSAVSRKFPYVIEMASESTSEKCSYCWGGFFAVNNGNFEAAFFR